LTAKVAETFFDSSRCSAKVQKQMSNASDVFHAFPPSVDGMASKYGRWETKMGDDGKTSMNGLKCEVVITEKPGYLST